MEPLQALRFVTGQVLPSEHSLNTYELWKEGVFFGCEQSIARYRDEITQYVFDRSSTGRKRWDLAAEACERAARCAPRLSTTAGTGGGKGKKAGTGKGKKGKTSEKGKDGKGGKKAKGNKSQGKKGREEL